MKRALPALLLLAALALGGCGPKWTHPYIASPREEDKKFEEHSAVCREEAARVSPDQSRAVFEDCMTLFGWEKKD